MLPTDGDFRRLFVCVFFFHFILTCFHLKIMENNFFFVFFLFAIFVGCLNAQWIYGSPTKYFDTRTDGGLTFSKRGFGPIGLSRKMSFGPTILHRLQFPSAFGMTSDVQISKRNFKNFFYNRGANSYAFRSIIRPIQ